MKKEVNILQYLALAALQDNQPKSAYEIKKFLEQNQVENWLPVEIESIFYSVQSLVKKGYIEEVSEKKFTLHESGKIFYTKQEKYFLSHFEKQFFTYKLAYKFAQNIDKDTLVFYTQSYKTELQALCQKAKDYAFKHLSHAKDCALIQHEIHLLEAELVWIRNLEKNNFYL